MIKLTTASRNYALDSGFRSMFSGGEFRIYSGTRPTGPEKPFNDEADVVLLAVIPLPSPPFAAASSGALAKTGTWQDPSANATETAAWGRFVAAGDDDSETQNQRRMDLDVSESGGGGDAIIDNEDVVAGHIVTITACAIGQPAE